MKIIKGIKIGGLQMKVFNLVLIFILLLMGFYAAVTVWHQRSLTGIVQDASTRQQESITEVSANTMESVMNLSMTQSTALQGYIADDLFNDVRTDVLTLQAFAQGLFEHAELFPAYPVEAPAPENEGTPAVMLIHEKGADPENSEALGLVGNMSEILLAMYEASDRLSSVFVGTADGNMVLVNDRSATYIAPDGSPLTLEIRQRPWYAQAEAAGKLIFTGVELDAYTDVPMLECAAPVYHDGKLVAVVSADVYLDAISDYVERSTSDGGFLCVVDGGGRVLFSSLKEGTFRAELSENAPDLRQNENEALARFVKRALIERTGLELITVDGKELYMTAAPMASVGWTVLSGIEKELTDQPASEMLDRFEGISTDAMNAYSRGAKHSVRMLILISVAIILLATTAALALSSRMVKPLELMTKRLNSLREGNSQFLMEDDYRTGDEIEVLAETFASLSKRSREYVEQLTRVTAEKERVSTELSMATQIQESMLPSIFPAFPDRPEFDIYATMDPAREVGGDFYDFFLIDEDHLCMVMADVSGKGVPAALFMMASKIILQSCAMLGSGAAEILTKTNEAICSNNQMEMFVTTWVGILEISTGRLTAANAGHEYPALCRRDGTFELFRDKHGFVLGGMSGVKYREYELTLSPGDRLFLYTDGVPEATRADNELFGTERMLAALNAAPAPDPRSVLEGVRAAVDEFVQEAEQFDDITMLCLEYTGPQARPEEAP